MICIVHVITDLDLGGAEVMLAKLVSGMDRGRFANVVVSLTDRGQVGREIEAAGVPVHCLGMRHGRPNLSALFKLIRLLRTTRPTLVQSWLYHADFLSLIATRFAGAPTLIWNVRCSDMDLRGYSNHTRWVLHLLAWFSWLPAAVLTNSAAGQRLHHAVGYRPRRWELVPNGFDLGRFRPDPASGQMVRQELGIPAGTVVVALIARLDPMKDHQTFLAAAARIVARQQGVCFLLVGKGVEKLADGIAERGLGGNVRLLGERRDIGRLLPGLDIVCLSSAFGEGFPNVLGEAMAAGVPCVTTDVGDAGTLVDGTGLVVPPRDASALADAILDLLERGQSERTALGAAARERIAVNYALPRIIERYEEIYAGLAAS